MLQFGRERGGDRWDLAGGELTQGGGKFGHGGRVTVERGEGFFFSGTEWIVAEAGSGTGDGEGLQGLLHLARQPAIASGKAFEFGKLGISFLRPLSGRGGVATGCGDFDEEMVSIEDFLQPEGLEVQRLPEGQIGACKKYCVSWGNRIIPRLPFSRRLTHGCGVDEEN